MRPSVRAAYHRFSEPLEGRVPFMYLDVKGLVTVAVGNLIDPMSMALHLPFDRPDGTRATQAEIVTDWLRVKGRQDLAKHGGMFFRNVAQLRLSEANLDRIVERKLDSVDAQLAHLFPAWSSWPADAQLALLSWAWAVGAAAKYPRMLAALRAGDFLAAAGECTINPQRGTIVKRNQHNRRLLKNAAAVVQGGLDPDLLYWPRDLIEDNAETVPALPDDPDDETTDVIPVPEMREPPFAKVTIIHPRIDFPKRNYPDPDDEPA